MNQFTASTVSNIVCREFLEPFFKDDVSMALRAFKVRLTGAILSMGYEVSWDYAGLSLILLLGLLLEDSWSSGNN